MSGAEGTVRGGIAAALRGNATLVGVLNGVFEGPAVRASAPYAEVAEALASDWSTKDARGRELRVAVMLRDVGERPERLAGLVDAAERAIEEMPRELDGWRVASLAFVRSRTAGDGPGRWLAALEYRVRVLEIGGE